MLEVLYTFVIILFAGYSVTLGVLLGKRPPLRSCNGEPQAAGNETSSKCDSCRTIGACREHW